MMKYFAIKCASVSYLILKPKSGGFIMKTLLTIFVIFFALTATNSLLAADDPSIQGKTRINTQKAMADHIQDNTYNSSYIIYDAVTGELLKLKFGELHKGIVKKGEFYVSCADFTDTTGSKYDLDFLVVENGGDFEVFEAIVHKVDGNKRKYSLEN